MTNSLTGALRIVSEVSIPWNFHPVPPFFYPVDFPLDVSESFQHFDVGISPFLVGIDFCCPVTVLLCNPRLFDRLHSGPNFVKRSRKIGALCPHMGFVICVIQPRNLVRRKSRERLSGDLNSYGVVSRGLSDLKLLQWPLQGLRDCPHREREPVTCLVFRSVQ